MFGILGIVLSLALLIALAYRGWNVIVIAPICAMVGLLFGGLDAPLIATYTQVFMPALGNYLIKFFPLFLLGAVFGKLMDDSGCAQTIAHKIVEWTGKERAIIAIILACGVLTYGGVSLFVVAFAVFPVAMQMFREGNLPKRLIPAAIAVTVAAAISSTVAISVTGAIPAAIARTIAAPVSAAVTSAIAAFKREDDIAIGNVVGSNLFNVLGVLGGAAAASPIAVSQDLYAFELPVLAVSALILVPLMWRRAHIGRIEGVLLLAGFVAFTALTLIRGGN